VQRGRAAGRIGSHCERRVEKSELEREVAGLIAEAVNLETSPGESDPALRLCGDGLGLDSIDLLEIALAISKKYGFQLRSDDPENARIFSSLRSLAAHIEERRAR
jgi:acyl carrier protein